MARHIGDKNKPILFTRIRDGVKCYYHVGIGKKMIARLEREEREIEREKARVEGTKVGELTVFPNYMDNKLNGCIPYSTVGIKPPPLGYNDTLYRKGINKIVVWPSGKLSTDYGYGNLTVDSLNRTIVTGVDGRDTRVKLSKILADCFLDNPNNFPFIIFKDGDPTNSKVDNLMWSNKKPKTAKIGYNISVDQLIFLDDMELFHKYKKYSPDSYIKSPPIYAPITQGDRIIHPANPVNWTKTNFLDKLFIIEKDIAGIEDSEEFLYDVFLSKYTAEQISHMVIQLIDCYNKRKEYKGYSINYEKEIASGVYDNTYTTDPVMREV